MDLPESFDDKVLERAQNGDRVAFDELVAPHLSMLRSLVRRLIAHPEDTHDVTQEALLLAYRRLPTFAEAAAIVGVSESVLRHKLAAGRRQLQSRFDGLCALVSKNGVCWQCEGLRGFHPEGKQGVGVPSLGPETDSSEQKYVRRLAVVQDADVHEGRAQAFHDLVWRRMSRTEERRDFADIVARAIRG